MWVGVAGTEVASEPGVEQSAWSFSRTLRECMLDFHCVESRTAGVRKVVMELLAWESSGLTIGLSRPIRRPHKDLWCGENALFLRDAVCLLGSRLTVIHRIVPCVLFRRLAARLPLAQRAAEPGCESTRKASKGSFSGGCMRLRCYFGKGSVAGPRTDARRWQRPMYDGSCGGECRSRRPSFLVEAFNHMINVQALPQLVGRRMDTRRAVHGALLELGGAWGGELLILLMHVAARVHGLLVCLGHRGRALATPRIPCLFLRSEDCGVFQKVWSVGGLQSLQGPAECLQCLGVAMATDRQHDFCFRQVDAPVRDVAPWRSKFTRTRGTPVPWPCVHARSSSSD